MYDFWTVNLILRMTTLGIGIFFLVYDFIALVKRLMTDLLAIGWLIVSIILILFGAIPVLGTWTKFVSMSTGLTFMGIMFLVLFFLFRLCFWVSSLFWQNKELAMQISLLNQENEEMRRRANRIEKELKLNENREN